jgi:hypothetical protein
MMRKLGAYLRWAGTQVLSSIGYGGITVLMLLVQLLTWNFWGYTINLTSLVFTSWIAFTLLWPFRNTSLRKTRPFWFYFDDEDEFGYDLPWFLPEMKNGFKKAWLWAAVRNPMWNLQASLTPKQGSKTLFEIKELTTTRNGVLVGYAYPMANAKFVDENEKNLGNKGKYLSLKYSVIGEQKIWYEVDGTLYFRFSKVYKTKNGAWKERQYGTSDERHLFRRKNFGKIKTFEEKDD